MLKYISVEFDPFKEEDVIKNDSKSAKSFLFYFDQNVLIRPNKIAISFKEEQMTFKQLDDQSSQLANLLVENGVHLGDTVAMILNRSPKMIVALLAISKCGATFLPLDPTFPHERILYMLDDSSAKLVLTSKDFKDHFTSKTKEILLDRIDAKLSTYSKKAPDLEIEGNLVAYILYTSGSTGKPKGVQIRHLSLLNFLLSMQKAPGIQPEDKFLACTTISFDISILEIFLPLMSGAEIVLIDEEANRNGRFILKILKKENITIIQSGPTLFNLMIDEGWDEKLPLKVLCGGENFPSDLAKKLLERSTEVWNMYGPTETTIWSTIKKLSKEDTLITVGKPIDNTQVYILDNNLNRVPMGSEGEIYIAGEGLALGYLNRPELTAEKFIDNPFESYPNAKMYGTGDMGILLENGEIQCLGRLDHQIKIAGIRIELGEIEQVILQKEKIKAAIVIVREDNPGEKYLCAYVIPNERAESAIEASWKTEWRQQLNEGLPTFMVPSDFVIMDQFPLTPNGKIDRKGLPKPEPKRPELSTLYAAPNTEIEIIIESIWASILRIENIGIEDNFFDLGGNSLLAIKLVSELQRLFKYELPITKLYQSPTIKSLAVFLEDEIKKHHKDEKLNKKGSYKSTRQVPSVEHPKKVDGIAVIAMSGRFPGANTIEEFWDLLQTGREGISFFTKEELDPSISDEKKDDPDYVRARGIIEDVEYFDSSFFGINPRLAELMDPQQRIFLEISWEALESAGYTNSSRSEDIGVFAGCANSDYFINNVQHHKNLIDNVGEFQVILVNEKDYLSSRVSYALDLKGPAITVQSACSTSLLAIAQAVESLKSGKCHMALAGGVNIWTPTKIGHLYQEGSMQSADGHCRPFDSEATGTIFSDGAGVVLLKPLEAALRDGDTIYGIIKGVGMSNDGARKGSFTAPSSEGQSKAIKMAMDDAKFDPSTISYIETHGTATPLGDPIEFEGLKQAFGTQEKTQYCAIGSVKSNMGHLNTAAGVTGFIKATLALYYKQIPPSINYVKPNPHIDFKNSPFYVNTELNYWMLNEGIEKRRSGVSSFGVGGTNVHLVLEEADHIDQTRRIEKPYELINWSAKTERSRDKYAQKLSTYTKENPFLNLSEFAYSLQTTRSEFHFRRFLIASNQKDLIGQLDSPINPIESMELKENMDEIVFMFPGQGSQYIMMGKELYDNETAFKDAVDECAQILMPYLNEDIREIIFPITENEEDHLKINNTYYTQPALFVIEYSIAKLFMSFGIKPSVLIGHSIGEFVAAHLSGVFSLEDALQLIAFRGRLMSTLPGGKMLAIRSNHESIKSMLPSVLSIAAINSPGLCVIAGSTDDVAEFANQLDIQLIPNTHLHTSHAFHSTMMDDIVVPYENFVKTIQLNTPCIPIISTVTGTWMTDEEVTSPSYWASHLRKTVNFSAATSTLLSDKKRFILECGPKNVLTTLVKQQGIKGVRATASLHLQNDQSEYYSFLKALGQIWLNGIKVDWYSYYSKKKNQKLKLPSYAFDRKRYWISPIVTEQLESKLFQGSEPI